MASSSSSDFFSQSTGGENVPVVNSDALISSFTEIFASAVGPIGGVPNTSTSGDKTETAVTSNSPLTGHSNRLEGYSVAKLKNNTAIIAYAARDQYIYPVSGDTVAAQQILANRIYLTNYNLSSSKLCGLPRKATLLPKDDNFFYMRVDDEVFTAVNNTNLDIKLRIDSLYFLNGPFARKEKNYVDSVQKQSGGLLVLPYFENEERLDSKEFCVDYIPFNRDTAHTTSDVLLTNALSDISPLPFLEVDDRVVSVSNPKVVAYSPYSFEGPYAIYVFVEAPVDGVMQLFMYGVRTHIPNQSNTSNDTAEEHVWHQLTFVGENKNLDAAIDSSGTVHLVWQSSRCEPDQLCYGTLGAMSGVINNEILTSAIDKQAQLKRLRDETVGLTETDDQRNPPTVVSTGLTSITSSTGVALDLTQPGGRMWSKSTSGGGSCTVSTNTSIIASGNPSSAQMIAFTSLDQDEDGNIFDGEFEHLSYQLAFDFNVAVTGVSGVLDDEDIAGLYETFLPPAAVSSDLGSKYNRDNNPNVNFYIQDDNVFTADGVVKTFGDIIPIAGSYRLDALKATLAANTATITSGKVTMTADGLNLRHYMLALVPEVVTFRAVNVMTESDFLAIYPSGSYVASLEEVHYTGRFRFALAMQTSGTRTGSQTRNAGQVVRMFGTWLSVGDTSNITIATHYRHLPKEAIAALQKRDFVGASDNSLRYQCDVMISFAGETVMADTFFVDMSDGYKRFDIGLGVPKSGEYLPNEIAPFENSSYLDKSVTLTYTNISISPHTLIVNDAIAHVSSFDRRVDKMWVTGYFGTFGSYGATSSATVTEALNVTEQEWETDFGLFYGDNSLTQVPFTFEGVNAYPSICVDYCDKLHVAWQSYRDRQWEIYYTNAIESSLALRFDTRISNSEGKSVSPSLTVDSAGRRLIAWHDDRTGVNQVYVATAMQTRSCHGLPCRIQEANILQKELDDLYLSSSSQSHSGTSSQSDSAEAETSCTLVINYTNSGMSTKKFHFRVTFYRDAEQTNVAKMIFSRDDVSHWYADNYNLPFDGVQIASSASSVLAYKVTEDDDLDSTMYWVKVEPHDGTSFLAAMPAFMFYCAQTRNAKCSIPIAYTNSYGSTENVDFRLTFYSDEAMSTAVYSTSTTTDIRKWRGATSFPISVLDGTSVSVVFDPEVLPLSLSSQYASEAVLCNVQYYVRVEYNAHGVWNSLQTFTFQCPCKNTKDEIWRRKNTGIEWTSSGQGSTDLAVTNGTNHSMFPKVDASFDGLAYIVWEDHRFSSTSFVGEKKTLPGIWFAVYDLVADTLYSSAQNSFNRIVKFSSTTRTYKPCVLVDGFQNPVFFYNDRYNVYRKVTTLEESSTEAYFVDYANLFDENTELNIDEECLRISLYKNDNAGTYYNELHLPVNVVNNFFVRFTIDGPPNIKGVRFKNESEEWSPWLSVLPELPTVPVPDVVSSSEATTAELLKNHLEAYFVGKDSLIAPWVLSSGVGAKTVSAQLLTANGRTSTFSIDLFASYKEFAHRIYFYSDEALTKPLSTYNGTPVASTKATETTITVENVASILDDRTDVANIYFKVVFEDEAAIQSLLALRTAEGFHDNGVFTFNVVRRGLTKLFGQTFDSGGSPDSFTGTLVGHFSLSESDGIEYADGPGIVTVNIPDPRIALGNSQASIIEIDKLNRMNSPFGPYSRNITDDAVELQAEDIRAVEVSVSQSSIITKDQFRELYAPELSCSFYDRSCTDAEEPDDILSVSSSSSQSNDGTTWTSNPSEPDAPTFAWRIPHTSEPGYWSYQTNGSVYARHSEVFTFDMSNPFVSGIRFGAATRMQGLLFMIKDSDHATVTWSGVAGTSITLAFPSNAIVFPCTSDYVYLNKANAFRAASCQKTFTGGGTSTSIPKKLNAETFSFSTFGSNSWTTMSDLTGVPIATLRSEGFIDEDNMLRFKLVHVVCGEGFLDLGEITVNTSFDESSSSTSGGLSSSSSSSSSSQSSSSSSSSNSSSSSSSSSNSSSSSSSSSTAASFSSSSSSSSQSDSSSSTAASFSSSSSSSSSSSLSSDSSGVPCAVTTTYMAVRECLSDGLTCDMTVSEILDYDPICDNMIYEPKVGTGLIYPEDRHMWYSCPDWGASGAPTNANCCAPPPPPSGAGGSGFTLATNLTSRPTDFGSYYVNVHWVYDSDFVYQGPAVSCCDTNLFTPITDPRFDSECTGNHLDESWQCSGMSPILPEIGVDPANSCIVNCKDGLPCPASGSGASVGVGLI